MDWKSVVAKAAPVLGAALGGPMGGIAVASIADALGLSDKTEAAITVALAGTTSEQMLALKNADQEFKLKMQEGAYADAKDTRTVEANDRDSARKREMVVKDNTPRNLAYIITAGYFLLVAALMFGSIPVANKDILFIMFGTMGAAWSGVLAYYFSTTAGSKHKTELLAKADAVIS
jgi:hypothetical protein